MVITGGENAKNEENYFNQIIDAIDRHGIDRHSYVAAIGGGAVLDFSIVRIRIKLISRYTGFQVISLQS